MSHRLILLIATLATCAAADDADGSNKLIAQYAAKGISGFWVAGRACRECPRGLIATGLIKKGVEIGRLNLNDCIDLGLETSNYRPKLLERILLEPGFNATFGDYLDTLPKLGEVHTMQTMSAKHREMLQAEQYEQNLKDWEAYGAEVAEALTRRGRGTGAFNWTITPDVARHYMALVATRLFHFPVKEKDGPLGSFMCPVVDMVNHAPKANINIFKSERGMVHMVAVRNIRKGEELLWNYNVAHMDRPDLQMLIYGFLLDTAQPALSHVDEPSFGPDSLYHPPPVTDPSTFSLDEAAAELARVRGILAGLPTSLEQDVALLESGELGGDGVAVMVLRWRVQRKRALRQREEALLRWMGEL